MSVIRYLLDSHIAYWAMGEPDRLTTEIRERLESGVTAWISAASIWELRLKATKGKLRMSPRFEAMLKEQSFRELPVTWEHARRANELPPIHRDPFDRLLVAQAIAEDFILVSRDRILQAYPVAMQLG